MKRFNNFSLYTPDASDLEHVDVPQGALFLRSDAGVDWYEAQSEFGSDTLKVMVDSAGVICCVEKDVSALWPVDCSVFEIRADKLPEEFVCNGSFVWNGKAVTQKKLSQAEIIAKNEAIKARLISAANSAIAPLQDALELDIITQDESARLLELKRHRVMLSRVDTSNPVWPDALQ